MINDVQGCLKWNGTFRFFRCSIADRYWDEKLKKKLSEVKSKRSDMRFRNARYEILNCDWSRLVEE